MWLNKVWLFARRIGSDHSVRFDGLFGKGKPRVGGAPDEVPHPAMPWQDVPAFFAKLKARPETEARALE